MNEIINIETIPVEATIVKPNIEYARSLRLIADFYEANEKMFIPQNEIKIYSTSSKEDFALCAKIMKTFEKSYDESFTHLTKKFGVLKLIVSEYREKICERVVVGKKKVIKDVAVSFEKKEVEEDIVEWKCRETSLLNHSSTQTLETT